jgi:hypothetical protein
MKSKFKDYLLYTLSTIGVVALFISATTLPPQSSTVPESHVWEIHSDGSSAVRMYAINKKTGEVRKYISAMSDNVFANYIVMKQK